MKTTIRIESEDISVLKNGDDFELKIRDDFSLIFSYEILVKFSEHLKNQDRDLILKDLSPDMKIFEKDLVDRIKKQFIKIKEGKSDSFKAGVEKCFVELDKIIV